MKSIKNNRPNKKSGFVQGYFPMNEAKKYTGPGPIIYRSSWERKFCLYCERNSQIDTWSSESIVIKYFNPLSQKYHNYFPDFVVKTREGKIILVEVKPKSQLKKPNPPKRKTIKSQESYKWAYETWLVNQCKKDAAENFCKSNGWIYQLVTEDFFKNTTIQ